ncbi:MAG: ABC transporter permease [Candidatus Cohnella colombiensis]|uniref:ABC transporter permease n=1 Tax=Candidatus Cohnella colombiensis TaxID=3121368 RepID=A0AA95F0F9_9BACL|nr:MAG: ABC transporter permease [Cohnella sp.]
MTFRQFAFNNVIRNKRTYAAYFFSSSFSVMVFFMYAVFAFHPGIVGSSIHKNVVYGMQVAEVLIYVFSFFFVLYSMSAFLNTRKKEFGLLTMLGMTKRQLRTMVFLENVLIGLSATVSGIVLGLVMSKLMLLVAENALHLEISLPFYIPIHAVLLTFVAFILLFVFISFFTVSILRTKKLIVLIKGSSVPKQEPKASAILSWLAVILLGMGYTMALWAKGIFVVYVMIPVIIMVIIGTYFFFTQLSVFLIHKSKKNRSLFWRKTNLLFLSDLAYRMKDNARTFFMVAILSTVAFSAIGSLVGFKTMSNEMLTNENPFAFEFVAESKDTKHNQEELSSIESTLIRDQIDYTMMQAEMSIQFVKGSDRGVTLVRASQFNAIANAAGEETAELEGNQAMLIYYQNALSGANPFADAEKNVTLVQYEQQLEVIGSISSVTLPIFKPYYVVDDSLFNKLEHERLTTFYAFDTVDVAATQKVGEELNIKFEHSNNTFFSLAYERFKMNQQYAIVFFIGLFIGAIFFVAAASFLYFRLYTDLDDDKRKFTSIMKLGLTEGELSGILTKQLIMLFLVPIAVATIHGAVALTALQHLFGYSLMKESLLVLASFVGIQMIYFVAIRSKYIKQVLA